MTAPSKPFTPISDGQIDPNSPIDTTLMTSIRDALVHLEEWVGKDFTAAVNHNHDGVNSAAIEVGPNYLRNGGFENALAGWTDTIYTGGTVAVGSSNEVDGVSGLVITSTVAANGGGNVISEEFIPVPGGQTRQFTMIIKASGATVPIKSEVIWYDEAQAQISASTIISTTTASPTTNRLVVRRIAAPALARYCQVKCELPAAGSAAGSIYFDAITVGLPAMLGGEQVFTASGTFSAVWGDVLVVVQGGGGAGGAGGFGSIVGGAGGGGGGAGGTALGFVPVYGDVTVTVGGVGGTSSFAASATLSATGGAGGTAGAAGSEANVDGGPGGAGGAGSGGSINLQGGDGSGGGSGFESGGASISGTGGAGGASHLSGGGGGGAALFSTTTGARAGKAGTAGNNYGAGGGGGGGSIRGGAVGAAGSGVGGIVIVRW